MPKQKKHDHDYTCDNCDRPADYNLQNCWQLYSIKKDGNFEKEDEFIGDSNEFFCEQCYLYLK